MRMVHARKLAALLGCNLDDLFAPSDSISTELDDDKCEVRSDTQCDDKPCPECPIYPTDQEA